MQFVFQATVLYIVAAMLVGPVTAAAIAALGIRFLEELTRFAERDMNLREDQLVDGLAMASLTCFFVLTGMLLYAKFGIVPVSLCASVVVTLMNFKHSWLLKLFGLNYKGQLPRPARPVAVPYRQEHVSDMLALRQQMLQSPIWAPCMRRLSVGSYWMETACSVLLHREVYNSRQARQATFFFFNYFLPTVFTLQVCTRPCRVRHG